MLSKKLARWTKYYVFRKNNLLGRKKKIKQCKVVNKNRICNNNGNYSIWFTETFANKSS